MIFYPQKPGLLGEMAWVVSRSGPGNVWIHPEISCHTRWWARSPDDKDPRIMSKGLRSSVVKCGISAKSHVFSSICEYSHSSLPVKRYTQFTQDATLSQQVAHVKCLSVKQECEGPASLPSFGTTWTGFLRISWDLSCNPMTAKLLLLPSSASPAPFQVWILPRALLNKPWRTDLSQSVFPEDWSRTLGQAKVGQSDFQ